MAKNIYPVFDRIYDRKVKEEILRQSAKVIWFTGLSGAGKTTLAANLEKELFFRRFFCHVLDGDNIRTGINSNLGFSEEDRLENIRRIAEASKLLINTGMITICSFISPTDEIRNLAKSIIGENDFIFTSECGAKQFGGVIQGDGLLYDLFVGEHFRIRVYLNCFFFGRASTRYKKWLPGVW